MCVGVVLPVELINQTVTGTYVQIYCVYIYIHRFLECVSSLINILLLGGHWEHLQHISTAQCINHQHRINNEKDTSSPLNTDMYT